MPRNIMTEDLFTVAWLATGQCHPSDPAQTANDRTATGPTCPLLDWNEV